MKTHLRIIGAVALKDITDALKNRTILIILLSMLFLIGMYRVLPLLESIGQAPNVLVYDAGDSTLVPLMESSLALKAWTGYQSEAHMKEKLASGQAPELGLVIPADFDAGNETTLQGYVLYWVNEKDAVALKQRVEEEISRLAGRSISIHLEGNTIFMQPDSSGYGLLAGLGMSFTILMIGVSLVPNLMLDEKQGRTMDALLVSPAGPVHVTLAKALAGLFYAAATIAVALALYNRLITHWWLTVCVMLCGALFAVALGLLLGSLTESRQQLTVLGWGVVIPLFVPMMLVMVRNLLPTWLYAILRWIPSVALFEALRISFSQQPTLAFGRPTDAQYGLPLALLLAWTGALLALVAWRVRQIDR
jgi:ABC-2 type transport system permease protein